MESSIGYNWMLAIDYSLNTTWAFSDCLTLMNQEKDHLYLIAVAEQPTFMPVSAMGTMIAPNIQLGVQAEQEAEHKTRALLGKYAENCRVAGVKNYHTVLGRGSHVGEVICKAVEKKKIDYLIVGRRGMSKIKRLFIGSTSKYCLEHASCSVIVMKMPPELEKEHLAAPPVTAVPSTTTPIDDKFTQQGEKIKPIAEEYAEVFPKVEYFHLEESTTAV